MQTHRLLAHLTAPYCEKCVLTGVSRSVVFRIVRPSGMIYDPEQFEWKRITARVFDTQPTRNDRRDIFGVSVNIERDRQFGAL